MSCSVVSAAASDYLDGVLSPSEQADLKAHLDGCDACPAYLAQLRTTIGLLNDRADVTVPEGLLGAVAEAMASDGDRQTAEEAFADHGEHLYLLATTIAPDAAEDLVQSTLLRAFEEGAGAFERDRLSRTLLDIAANTDVRSGAALEGSVYDHDGSADAAVERRDADADTAELFYPAFYTDGPDAGAWIAPPNAWPGEPRILTPEADLATAELIGVVEAGLAGLDPFSAGVLALVDIDGGNSADGDNSADVAQRLGRDHVEVRQALHVARNHVRSTVDAYLTAPTQPSSSNLSASGPVSGPTADRFKG